MNLLSRWRLVGPFTHVMSKARAYTDSPHRLVTRFASSAARVLIKLCDHDYGPKTSTRYGPLGLTFDEILRVEDGYTIK